MPNIISPLPYTLTNGTTADASQVQGDLAQIVSNVNSNAAENGTNASITRLNGLTTPLSVSQGGTNATTAAAALTSLGAAVAGALGSSGITGAAASGANSDITSLSALSTPLSIGQGGTGGNSASAARSALSAAASGANADITSLSGLTTPLPFTEGGTGLSSPGSTGNVLTSSAGSWVSQAPAVGAKFTGTASLVTSNNAITISHGLGAIPSIIQVSLQCTASGGDNGYSHLDEIDVASLIANQTQAGVVWKNATTIGVTTYANFSAGLYGIQKTGSTLFNFSGSNWQWIFRAFL
jgi:hypothetical protein